jgi:hypothetical protein
VFLPAVFFFVTALPAIIADALKFLPLGFPVPSVIVVSATFISVAPTFILVWALVSFVVGRTAFVASCSVFVDISQGRFVPVVLNFLAGPFFVSLDSPLLVH